ncbi:MAG TPA: M20/M25/M40 family metallo-hydrolase [Bryobacteraceae bacterium]|nr:M20/M25/M40 family metallo-hydrolase [Bryobacteraceae bacterium]
MKIFKRALAPILLCAAWTALAADPAIDPSVYLDDVKFLASPELRGRGTGSPELEKAADFIGGKFREFGLKPADGKSFFQSFPVVVGAKLGKDNRFQFTQDGRPATLRCPEDFVPLNISSSGKLAGAVVFAGYGITAPEYQYDDYAGLDVKGKIVLILRHEPQENDEHSVFAGKNFTMHATFASKAANAKAHEAAGVILISDTAAHHGEANELEKLGAAEGPTDAGIVFMQVKAADAVPWFQSAGKSLDDIQAGIDKDLKPESFAFPETLRVDASVDLVRERKTVRNVAALLPGTTDEYVILGAHYDHLGLGGPYSLAPSMTGTVHPGADDNASGAAGVIELARWFASQPKQKRGILFLEFAGEEMGLLGSAWYAGHPELPLEKAAAMLNMDMIGRVRGDKVYIGGAGTATDFRPMLEEAAAKVHLKADLSDNAGFEGASDHVSFVAKQVPVLFFFSGLHADYHKPSDTWDKIDAPDAVRVLDLVADVTEQLREAGTKPQFVRVLASPHGAMAVGPVGGSSGYGPYFGSVPDFGGEVKGVKFADVREGSPAATAGLKGGDVLVEFDGKKIENLYDFTYALRARKPGDVVKVKVLRGDTPVEVMVTLTKRQ